MNLDRNYHAKYEDNSINPVIYKEGRFKEWKE